MANAKVSRSTAAAQVAAARRASKPTVDPTVRAAIKGYCPAGIDDTQWQQVRSVVIEAVLGMEPPSVGYAQKLLRQAALLATWAVTQGVAATRQAMFNADVVEAWTAHQLRNGVDERSVATYRSRLRHIVGAHRTAVGVKRRKLAAPYSAEDDLALRRAVVGQRTPGIRTSACLLYGLARGAGLSSSDLSELRIGDIHRSGDTVRIEARGRTLWVLDSVVDVLQIGLELTNRTASEYAVGSKSSAKREVSRAAHRLKLPRGIPALSVSRCRSTWIVDHLNAGTPVPVIAEALGVGSTRFVDDLLEFCETTPAADRQRLLRGIT